MDNISFMPLALTVMLGPQILVPMLLITRTDPIKSSLIYMLSVTTTLIVTTYLYYIVIKATGFHKISFNGEPILKYILASILFVVLIKTIINRKKITQPPKWMANVTKATLSRICLIGFMLIAFMPGDIAMAFTVGSLLNASKSSIITAIPFFALVGFIATMPLLIYLSLGKKGHLIMDKLNTWLNTHGYLINIITLSVFIYLILD